MFTSFFFGLKSFLLKLLIQKRLFSVDFAVKYDMGDI